MKNLLFIIALVFILASCTTDQTKQTEQPPDGPALINGFGPDLNLSKLVPGNKIYQVDFRQFCTSTSGTKECDSLVVFCINTQRLRKPDRDYAVIIYDADDDPNSLLYFNRNIHQYEVHLGTVNLDFIDNDSIGHLTIWEKKPSDQWKQVPITPDPQDEMECLICDNVVSGKSKKSRRVVSGSSGGDSGSVDVGNVEN